MTRAPIVRRTAAQDAAHQPVLPGAPAVTPRMAETILLEAIRKVARLLGYLEFHDYDSRRSTPGFPDLVLTNLRQGRLIFAELKTDTGRTTPHQDAWLTALRAAHCEVYVWRPIDLPDIPAILRPRRAAAEQADAESRPT